MTDQEKVTLCDRLIEQLRKEQHEAYWAHRIDDLLRIAELIDILEKKKGEFQ